MDKYILLVAATGKEIQPTLDFLEQQEFSVNDNEIEVLITGIGSINTTYLLTYNINYHRPDYLIQAGIAGSFSQEYQPGSLVFVKEEAYGDLGVEEGDIFKDVFDMGLQERAAQPFADGKLVNPNCDHWIDYNIPFVKGITINEITTRPSRIQQLQQKYQPVVESMEGAAFYYSCLMQGVTFMQLRAISNYVGERDKTKWKMAEAIGTLNEKLVKMIQRDWDFLPNYA